MDWIIVNSSNLEAVAYDLNDSSLFVKFHQGGVYQYFDVPKHIFENLLSAPSHGKYHARFIKRNFRYIKI